MIDYVDEDIQDIQNLNLTIENPESESENGEEEISPGSMRDESTRRKFSRDFFEKKKNPRKFFMTCSSTRESINQKEQWCRGKGRVL
jgi:hypothetical protein